MRVCLLLGEPAGQYFRAAIRGGSAINIITVGWKMSSVHAALYAGKESERESEDGKKYSKKEKQMQGGAVQMVVNLSRLANKQCFSVIIHKTALNSALSPHRLSLPLRHWLFRAVSQPASSSLASVWADLVQKAGGKIYRPLH